MVAVEVLRVFTDDQNRHGNPLGVVLDGPAIPDPQQRQKLAAALGFSETIFIDGVEDGRLRIFTPATELPFAGHPAIGAAWMLAAALVRSLTIHHGSGSIICARPGPPGTADIGGRVASDGRGVAR
jgi:PhzF family phenazine biosynthesis protein